MEDLVLLLQVPMVEFEGWWEIMYCFEDSCWLFLNDFRDDYIFG